MCVCACEVRRRQGLTSEMFVGVPPPRRVHRACECDRDVAVAQLPVFVQVNTSGEPQKYGVAPETCVELSRYVAKECPGLALQGLMTIGKYDESAAVFFEVGVARSQLLCGVWYGVEVPVDVVTGLNKQARVCEGGCVIGDGGLLCCAASGSSRVATWCRRHWTFPGSASS